MEALGGPVDLSRITADSYLVAGIADHISPWENAYRTTQLLGSSPGSCSPPRGTWWPW